MNYTKAQYIELFGEEAYKEYLAKARERAKKYREQHPEKVKDSVRKNNQKHHDTYRELHKKHQAEHKEERNAYFRNYYRNNKEYQEKSAKAAAERRQADPVFAYLECLRGRYVAPNKPFDEYVMEVLMEEEPSLLDTEEMYKWLQYDIKNNLTFGIFRILKNFVWLMKIKIYKDEELTEHEKEMWKYFATAKYNIKAPLYFFIFKTTLVRVPPEYLTAEALKNGKLKLYWELDEMFKRAKGLTKDEE